MQDDEPQMKRPEPHLELKIIPIMERGFCAPSFPRITSLPYELVIKEKREKTDDDQEGDVEEGEAEIFLDSTATHYILSKIEETVSWILTILIFRVID